jgi:predicted nucleic acid-binding protein
MAQKVVTKQRHKRVLLDASSAILLAKAGFHETVAKGYDNRMSKSVFHEITRTSLPGSSEYRELLQVGRLEVVPVKNEPEWCGTDGALKKLDRGERDTILLFHSGAADFVITDDGSAARYCLKNRVPFVNSLLLHRLIYQSSMVTESSYEEGFQALVRLGWYSEKVKKYVRDCPDSELIFFFP